MPLIVPASVGASAVTAVAAIACVGSPKGSERAMDGLTGRVDGSYSPMHVISAYANVNRENPDIMPSAPAVLPDASSVTDLDTLFKGFADPTRIRILSLLAAGELCVCDIVEILGLPQPTVSRHLAYLRRSGLVDATREWKYAHYRLAEPGNAVHRNLIACVRSCFRGIASLDKERARAEARVRERAADPC